MPRRPGAPGPAPLDPAQIAQWQAEIARLLATEQLAAASGEVTALMERLLGDLRRLQQRADMVASHARAVIRKGPSYGGRGNGAPDGQAPSARGAAAGR